MQNILTYKQAWNDFYPWAQTQSWWNELTRAQRNYLSKTNIDVRNGMAGERRIKNALLDFSRGRYQFVELSGFIVADAE